MKSFEIEKMDEKNEENQKDSYLVNLISTWNFAKVMCDYESNFQI